MGRREKRYSERKEGLRSEERKREGKQRERKKRGEGEEGREWEKKVESGQGRRGGR